MRPLHVEVPQSAAVGMRKSYGAAVDDQREAERGAGDLRLGYVRLDRLLQECNGVGVPCSVIATRMSRGDGDTSSGVEPLDGGR